MTKTKGNGIAKPIVVLTAICLFISTVLAVVNFATADVIAAAAADRAEAARREVLPEATGFALLEAEGLPGTVREVYAAENGVGYVFMLATKGYGGTMELICGMDSSGHITACRTLAHSETAGLGAKTAEEPYRSQYTGQDSSLSGVSAITGATISSTAYRKAIQDAFAAFELVSK